VEDVVEGFYGNCDCGEIALEEGEELGDKDEVKFLKEGVFNFADCLQDMAEDEDAPVGDAFAAGLFVLEASGQQFDDHVHAAAAEEEGDPFLIFLHEFVDDVEVVLEGLVGFSFQQLRPLFLLKVRAVLDPPYELLVDWQQFDGLPERFMDVWIVEGEERAVQRLFLLDEFLEGSDGLKLRMLIFLAVGHLHYWSFFVAGICQRVEGKLFFFEEGDVAFHGRAVESEISVHVELLHDLFP
jgi:hypothetical protein